MCIVVGVWSDDREQQVTIIQVIVSIDQPEIVIRVTDTSGTQVLAFMGWITSGPMLGELSGLCQVDMMDVG